MPRHLRSSLVDAWITVFFAPGFSSDPGPTAVPPPKFLFGTTCPAGLLSTTGSALDGKSFSEKANREIWHLLAVVVVVVYVVADLRLGYNRLWKSWCTCLKRRMS